MLSALNDAGIYAPLVLGTGQSWNIASGRTIVVDTTVSGSGGLTLTGRGTVLLGGTNICSGLTTISNGTLQVNGVITNPVTVAGGTLSVAGTVTGPVMVNAGALSGTGTMIGPVVVNAGGTLAPGPAIGTLALSNTLTLRPGSFTSIDINKQTGGGDKITGPTSIAYGGTLVVNNQAGVLAPGDSFTIFSAGTYSGAFTRISPATPGTGLVWDLGTLDTEGILRVIATNKAPITAHMTGHQVSLSWPSNNLGWYLQSQTNAPGVGLTTNWVTVPGSASTNFLSFTINPGVGSVFFRLVSPPFSTAVFGSGDLIVLQVGNGSIPSTGAPGVLNEYSPAGGPWLSQLAIPTSGPNGMLFGSTGYGSGLCLSPDGRTLFITGYSVPSGSYSGSSIDGSSTTVSPAVLRAIGSVNAAGTFAVSVTTTQFTGTNLRSAATDGYGNFWGGGGAGGIVYLGLNSPPATLSTVSPATRNLNLVNGRLYYTTGSGQLGIMAFTGAPTSPATETMFLNTAGHGSATASPVGFAFNPAMTVAYVADNRSASTGGGIQRYNWNGTAWVWAYTLGYTLSSSKQVWELAADFSGSNPILYATTGESSANNVVCVTDTGSASAFTTLATAPIGDAFRGITFAPTP
jgi:hypothetical protein